MSTLVPPHSMVASSEGNSETEAMRRELESLRSRLETLEEQRAEPTIAPVARPAARPAGGYLAQGFALWGRLLAAAALALLLAGALALASILGYALMAELF